MCIHYLMRKNAHNVTHKFIHHLVKNNKPDNDNYPVIITSLTYTKQILAKENKLHQSNLNLKYSADVEEDTPWHRLEWHPNLLF